MPVHNVSAAAGAAVAVVAAVSAVVDGPVVLGGVDPAVAAAAATAAAVWNTYAAPPYARTTFHVHTAAMGGTTVGSIVIPCPGAVCNVTVDPTYTAVVNVLIHEFGHGLGLPAGARSGTGMVVDDGNHWSPEEIDPTEIMTATISRAPRLARFTVDAVLPTNHACDAGGCSHHHRCVYTFGATAPGVCWPRGYVLVDPDDAFTGATLIVPAVVVALIIGVTCVLWC